MSEEPVMLVCMPVAGTPMANVTHGSVERQCTVCTEAVWASRSGLAHAGAAALIACVACAARMMTGDDDVVIVPPSPAVLAEIAAHFGRN